MTNTRQNPPELQQLRQWFPSRDKRPQRGLAPANWKTDFDARLPFAQARASLASSRIDGLQFLFTADDPFFVIDLDNCVDAGEIAPWAAAIVEQFGTYAELSRSGTGIHIVGQGTPPGNLHRVRVADGEIELYHRERLILVTGDRLPSSPAIVADCQAELDSFYATHFGPLEARRREQDAAAAKAIAERRAACVAPPDAQTIIDRIRISRSAVEFDQLMNWNGEGDGSVADFRLCSLLAFWCGPDETLIEQIWAMSGLADREKDGKRKFDRPKYRRDTINNAIRATRAFFNWSAPEPPIDVEFEFVSEPTEDGARRLPDSKNTSLRPNVARDDSPPCQCKHHKATKDETLSALGVNLPTPEEIEYATSRCRRIKLQLQGVHNHRKRKIVGFSCGNRNCPNCAGPWIGNRSRWFAEIARRFPEWHYAELPSREAWRTVSQRMNRWGNKNGVPLLYIAIPRANGGVVAITTCAIKESKPVEKTIAANLIAEAIERLPAGDKVMCSKPIAFKHLRLKKHDEPQWEKTPHQAPLSRATIDDVEHALKLFGLNYELKELWQFDRTDLCFTVPDDWTPDDDARLWSRMLGEAWFAEIENFIVFT